MAPPNACPKITMLSSNVAMMRFRVPSFTLLTSGLLNSKLLDHQPSEILLAQKCKCLATMTRR
jgi:hypothetical protein